jgi:hypothetical protein
MKYDIYHKMMKQLNFIGFNLRCCHHKWFGSSMKEGRQDSFIIISMVSEDFKIKEESNKGETKFIP